MKKIICQKEKSWQSKERNNERNKEIILIIWDGIPTWIGISLPAILNWGATPYLFGAYCFSLSIQQKLQSPLPIATQVRSRHRRLPDPIRPGNRTRGSPAAIFSRLSSGFHRLVGGIPTYPSEKWWSESQLGWCSIPNRYISIDNYL